MSAYNGRRAPNVSQYIANLNTIPSAADMAAQQEFPNFEDDLALFTNTQFFDFDMNENVPDMPKFGPNESQAPGQKGMAFVNQPGFPYGNFPAFQQVPQPPQQMNVLSPHSLPPSPPNGAHNGYPVQQSQPTVPNAAQFLQHAPQQAGPQTGDKRSSASASLPSTEELEEGSHYAAEEDKRRRNTAASARFRVKKKQREQALEKTSKEMSEKVQILETRVGQLEMENKWLKGLIMEKNLNIDVSKMSGAAAAMSAAAVAKKNAAVKAAAAAADQEDDINDVKAATGNDGESDNEDDTDLQGESAVEVTPEQKKRGVGTKGVAVEA